MAGNTENLNIEVNVDLSEFRQAMAEMVAELKALNKSASSGEGSFGRLSSAMKRMTPAMKTLENHALGLRGYFKGLVDTTNDLITAKVRLAYNMATLAPAFAKASMGVGALGASLLSVAGGLGGLGAVAVPVVSRITDLDKAMASGNKELIFYAKEFDSMKKAFVDFSLQYTKPVGEIFNGAVSLGLTTLMKMKPVIDQVAPAVEGLVDTLNQKLNDGGLQDFLGFLERNAKDSVVGFLESIGYIIKGLTYTFMAFEPILKSTEQAMLGFWKSFADWAVNFRNTTQNMNGEQIFLTLTQSILNGIANLMGSVSSAIANHMTGILQAVISAVQTILPEVITNFFKVAQALVNSLAQMTPQIIQVFMTLLQTVANTIVTNAPILIQSGVTMLTNLIQGIIQNLPLIFSTVMTVLQTLVNAIVQNLPTLLTAGLKLLLGILQGIADNLPQIIQMALQIVMMLVNWIKNNLPLVINAGMKILIAVVNGIIQMLPEIISTSAEIINTTVDILIENLPLLVDAGMKILVAVVEGIIDNIPEIMKACGKVVKAIVNYFEDYRWSDVGKKIMNSIMDGLGNIGSKITGFVKGAVKSAGAKFSLKVAPTPVASTALKTFSAFTATASSGMPTSTVPRPINNTSSNTGNGSDKPTSLTVNLNSPKALSVQEANREFQKTLNRLALEW